MDRAIEVVRLDRHRLQAFVLAAALAAGGAAAVGWQLSYPHPALHQLYAVVATGSKVFAAGYDAQLVGSDDGGATWSVVEAFREAETVQAFATDGAKAIGVGPRGFYLYFDGTAWAVRPLPVGVTRFTAVTWGPRWLALAENGPTYSSVDGVTWTLGAYGLGAAVFGRLSSGGGRYVFTGDNGLYSSVDGNSWVQHLSFGLYHDAAYRGDRWVAVGHFRTATSPDGVNWTEHLQNDPGRGIMWSVAVGNGTFVAAGGKDVNSEYGFWRSADGVTWTAAPHPTGEGIAPGEGGIVYDVAFDGVRFIAADADGALFTSADGAAWSKRSVGRRLELSSIARSTSGFIAVGRGGVRPAIYTSADGAGWVDRSPLVLGSLQDFSKVVGHQDSFIAIRRFSRYLSRSTDGIAWTGADIDPSLPLGSSLTIAAIGSNGAQLVAAGRNDEVYTSADGVSWTRTRGAGGASNQGWVSEVHWTGTRWVLVGNFAAVVTSSDGITWTESPISGTTQVTSIATGGTTHVGVANGRIYRSSDLITWSDVTPAGQPTNATCSAKVVWTGSRFYAVGTAGVCNSADGQAWDFELVGRSASLSDLLHHGGVLHAVGFGILRRSAQPNQVPIAGPGTTRAPAGPNIVGRLTGSDPDGDRVWFSVVGGPGRGTVEITDPNTGAFRYTQSSTGPDVVSFTFRVDDGNASSTVATHTLEITAPGGGGTGGSGGGGGGSIDVLVLALVTIAALRRSRVRS